MAKVRRKAVYTDIFVAIFAFDGDELPLFAGQNERIFKGTEADKFCEFQAVTFPDLRASYSAR